MKTTTPCVEIDLTVISDEDLNQVVAEHCDTWRVAFPAGGPPHPETRKGGILLPYRWVNERTHERVYHLPNYLEDANAVMTLLEWLPSTLSDFYCATDRNPRWGIGLRQLTATRPSDWRGVDREHVHAKGTTFCRAACIALLKYHGVKVVGE